MFMIRCIALIGSVALFAFACGDKSTDSGNNGPAYQPEIPTAWAPRVTNTYFPLPVGRVWEYRGESGAGVETVRVEVLEETHTVKGVVATVVHDQVFLDGALIEDTIDWYAEDSSGNVWYLGEETKEYENGEVVGTEGSWEWGTDGALPGIYMWADPSQHVGTAYRQEFYEDEAEDWGKVVALGSTIEVPAGTYTVCVKTEDWPGLEPAALEHKYYAPGVGLVLETAPDGGGRVELVAIR